MKTKLAILAGAIASILTLSGCLGDSNKSGSTFICIRKVHEVNCTITNNKWINEILFIIPGGFCYGIASFLDTIIFNSIHFWTGDNPLASTTITDANGVEYSLAKTESTLTITNQATGEVATFQYDADTQTWSSIDANGNATTLAKLVGNNKAIVYTATGAQEVVF